ncbi:MAG: hypothetical protein M1815_001447 [Lichina confinis]|nr:MAG: hypothetical protein M1815_001447 [Lichina confinis]
MASEVHVTDDAAPRTSASGDREPILTLKLLSPSTEIPSPLILTDVPAALTVGELRLRIRDSIPNHPAPERQRLIHLGRMLGDQTEPLDHVFGLPALESSSTQVLHLVMSPLPARSPNMVRASPDPERDIRVPSDLPGAVSTHTIFNPQQVPPMAPHVRPDASHFPLMVQPEQLPPLLHPSMAELIQQPIPHGAHPHNMPLQAPHIAGQPIMPSHSHNVVASGGAIAASLTPDDYHFRRNVALQQRARVSGIRYGTGSVPREVHGPLEPGLRSTTSSAGHGQTNFVSGRNYPGVQPPLAGSHDVHPDNIDPRLHTWQITVTEGAMAIPRLPNGQGVGGSLTAELPGNARADASPLTPNLPLPPPSQPQQPSSLLPSRFSLEGHPATAAAAAARDAFEAELGLVPGQPYPAQSASPWARQAVRPSEPSHRRERGPIPSTPAAAAAATRPRRVRQRPSAVYSTAPPRPSAVRRTGPSSQTREHLFAAYRQPEDTTLYLLVSPEGPRGLLIAPSGQYRADLANAVYMPHMGPDATHRHPNVGGNVLLLPLDMPVEERYRPGTSRVRLSARTGRPGNAGPANAMLPQQQQPQRPAQVPAQIQVQQPAQQQRLQEENAGGMREILRIVLPVGGHLWLFIRLLGFVYFFTGGSGWRRTIVVILSALVIFAAQAGFLDGVRDAVWGPVRRHLEAVLPLADARPAGNRRAGAPGVDQAAPNNDNNNNNNVDVVNNPNNGPAVLPPRVNQDPDPAAIAARLIRQRQEAEAPQGRAWLTERLRSFERSVLIFLASLVPGVGERHIAARDAAEAAAEAAAAATEPIAVATPATEQNQNQNRHQEGATPTSAVEQQHPESSRPTAVASPSTHGSTTNLAPQASSQTAADPSRQGRSSTPIDSTPMQDTLSYSDLDTPSSTSEGDLTRSTGSTSTTAAAVEAPTGAQGGGQVQGEVADGMFRRRVAPQHGGHVEQGSGTRQHKRGDEGGEEHGYSAGQE